MSKKHQTYYLMVFIILASNSFFQFKPFQEHESKLKFVFYFSIFLGVILSYTFLYDKQNRIRNLTIRKQPIGLVISLFIVTLISAFNAYIYKDQSLVTSIITNLQTLSVYFLFFTVIGLRLNVRQFENLIILFGTLYLLVLLIDSITLPNPLFGKYSIDYTRGGVVRLRIQGFYWTVALFFFSIQQYIDKGKKIYLPLIVLCLLAAVLTFARQYIVLSFVLGFFFYFTGVSLKKKLNIVVLGLFFSLFVIPNTQIYKNFTKMTKEQMEKNKYEKEDVRMKDYRVFLFDYPRSTMQYLFGCGRASYGNSKYGDELERMSIEEHLIQVDVAWAGFVFYFGYIAVALLLFIILKSLFQKCPSRYYYLKYIILYISLCSIVGGSILFYDEFLIMFLSIYMLYRVSSLQKISETMTLFMRYMVLYTLKKKCIRAR